MAYSGQSKSAADYRRIFQDVSLTKRTAAGTDPATDPLIAVRNTAYTIYIQRITVTISTAAAKYLTFQDSATTPIVLLEVVASAPQGTYSVDYGDQGLALTEGKDLDLATDGAGVVCVITVEGYQRQTAVAVPSGA